jgi:hypothetical protein
MTRDVVRPSFLLSVHISRYRMNAFYAQSGGVTAVINASACGVIEMV